MSLRLGWPILQGLWYATRVTASVPRRSALLMWGYMAGAGIVLKFVMPNYKAIVAEISDLEGKYKRVHNNVRAASESIAFFGGGARERKVLSSPPLSPSLFLSLTHTHTHTHTNTGGPQPSRVAD